MASMQDQFIDRIAAVAPVSSRAPNAPWDSFGVTNAFPSGMMSGMKVVLYESVEIAVFTIEEAAQRLQALIDGAFDPDTYEALTDFLKQRFMRLELRQDSDGSFKSFLIDEISRTKIDAAQVTNLLSFGSIVRRYQKTSPEVAEQARRMLLADPEFQRALPIRQKLAPFLRAARGEASVAFSDWDEVRFLFRNLSENMHFTVQGQKGWIGEAYGFASSDPAENLALVARASAAGLALVLPAKTFEDAAAGRFVEGMPILVKETAVLASKVSGKLSHARMEQTFGGSYFAHVEELNRRKRRLAGTDLSDAQTIGSELVFDVAKPAPARTAAPAFNLSMLDDGEVTDLDAFMRDPGEVDPFAHMTRGASTGAFGIDLDRGSIVLMAAKAEDGSATLTPWDVEEMMEVPVSLAALKAGVYRKVDAEGVQYGNVDLNDQGEVRHLDMHMRLHNETGPAIEGPFVAEEDSYALDGQTVGRDEWEARRAPSSLPRPRPTAH